MSLFKSETIVTPTIISPTITGTVVATGATISGSPTINTPNIVGVVGAGSNAAAGSVGELKSTLIAVGGSTVSMSSPTAINILVLSLTAGDWDVEANVNFTAGSATVAAGSLWSAGITTTTGTIPVDGSEVNFNPGAITTTSFLASAVVPRKRISLSATTNVYAVGLATFSAGTVAGYGSITARRVR